MTCPLWLMNRSGHILKTSHGIERYGLPPIPFTVLNRGHSEEWDLIYSPRYGFGRDSHSYYIFIYNKSKFPLECLLEVLCYSHINLLIMGAYCFYCVRMYVRTYVRVWLKFLVKVLCWFK